METWRLVLASAIGIAVASCSDDPATLARRSSSSSGSTSGDTSRGDPSSSSGSTGGTSGTTSGTTSTTSGAPSDGSAEQLCVDTINAYRKTKGLPAYARWNDAETCSDGQAQSDGATRAAHGAFGKCGEFGQNECPGWPGPPESMIPQCLKAMWGEGPGGGHYEMMASTRFTKVACGFANGQGGVWSVQNFK